MLAGLVAAHAATTNFNWIATAPADYSVPADWDRGTVPGGGGPGISEVALFTNNVACNYASNSSAAPDHYWVGQMSLGAWDNSAGAWVMNGGTLLVSNALDYYAVTIGGRSGSGGTGGATFASSTGLNSVGHFAMNGGALTVARFSGGSYYRDSFILGLATGSTGTFTLNGGTANFLCGIEVGIYGAGILTVNDGALVDNGWLGVGRGNGNPYGSGTLNLTGGAIYMLPNFSGGTVGGTGGLYLNQGCTNATVNVSGGSLYAVDIGFAGGNYSPPPRDTLNISGGALYIGYKGIYTASGSAHTSVNISGGTFHTVDMIGLGDGGVSGDTNVDILSDGTNWTWAGTPPVNLTNSSFRVNGTSGPGYVTFAPEPGRTITLDNVWSGDGGLRVDGPGTLAVAGNNTYTGDTTIRGGTLSVIGTGSIAGSSNIIVAPGATFAGPASGAYTLGAGQVLVNDGSTPTLAGDINTGPGIISLNYEPGTPAFTVVGGALGLSTSTSVNVNNPGAALGPGSYKVISVGSGGAVTLPGGLPTVVTVDGGGIVPGQYASLSVSGNELYLMVTNDRPPVVANVVTNDVSVGLPWQMAITNLAGLAGWSDSDGDTVTLSSVGPTSANGTSVTSDGSFIYYNGPVTADDYFNYTITDGKLTAIGAVYLHELNPTAVVPDETNHVISLDGSWRFHLERANYNFGSVPDIVLPDASEPFQRLDFVEGAGWTNIAVPGNWEMDGFSPCTYYGPDNTSGLYRHWFQIPQSWLGRRVYLQFDGALDGAEIWLNGQPVPVNEPSWNIPNYHESGWTGFQVDLTAQARFGTTNLLAVRVIKKTPSVDLDTGDYFVMGGIYQPVTLYSVPLTNFADVHVETHLLANERAEVDVSAEVTGGNDTTPVSMILDGVETDAMATNGKAVFTQIMDQPRLWSAEFPNLYDLTLNLKDPATGEITETVTNCIGIREITITNGVLLLNGVPVKFAGVCDHASSPTKGSAIGLDFWRHEIKLMKAANINAIRTTHYPPDPAFYEACDELGMYVADELPYCWVSSVNDPNMQAAFKQRARETIRRDRNHPCVVEWAIGNENSAGVNLQTVADLVKSLDPTRPRSVSVFNASKYDVELSDAHYPNVNTMINDGINGKTSGHPFIFLENPNTWDIRLAADPGMYERWGICMQRTWDICEQYDSICGTFPFEWSDRAVQDPNPDSDYSNGSVQRLYSFPDTGIHLLKIKGMVDAFRDERPGVYELKNIYSPVQVSNVLTVASGQVSFPVQNRYSFTDLSHLMTKWQLERDGETIASGETNVSLPPLSSGTVPLSVPANALAYADTLQVDFILPDGDDVVAHRFTLKNLPPTSQLNSNLPSGLPIPQFNLITRANYNNPGYWTLTHRYPAHLTNVVLTPANATTLAQLHSLTADVIGGASGQDVLGQVQAEYSNNQFSYTLNWSGAQGNVQELGWTFELPAQYDHFSWNRDARWTIYPPHDIGRAAGTATPDSTNADITHLSRPDAFDFNSTKYDCNWAALTTATGVGLRVEFSPQQRFHCRAGGADDGQGYVLFVNQQVSPPNDISSGVVSDLYMTLNAGNVVQGSFSVGSNSNLVTGTTGGAPGGLNALDTAGGAGGGNRVELDFSGSTNASYSVWSSTNLMDWAWEGPATEIHPGEYQFFDPSITNLPYRFYRVSTP